MKKGIKQFIQLGLTVVIMVMLGSGGVVFGQQTQKDQIETLKIAFISNKMELTPKEAQVFWPLYNEYNDKIDALKKERRRKFRYETGNLDSLSTKEIESLVDSEMGFRERELDIQKDFNQKLKQTLPVKKVAQFYIAEESFKRELLKRLRDKQK